MVLFPAIPTDVLNDSESRFLEPIIGITIPISLACLLNLDAVFAPLERKITSAFFCFRSDKIERKSCVSPKND